MSTNASLPGVAGPLGLANDLLRGHVLTVDGRAVKRVKREYLLPSVSGEPIRATMEGRFLSEHPVLVVDGREYYTGGATPPFLLLISFLPVLFLFGGSFVAVLLAILGVMFNLWIVRAPRGEAWKSAVILGVFVAAVLFTVFWAFFSGWVLSLIGR